MKERVNRKIAILLSLLAVLGTGTNRAVAQEAEEPAPVLVSTLVNLDTPVIPKSGRGFYHLDIRAPGGVEGQTYYGIGAQIGISPKFALLARATFADQRLYTRSVIPIRKGGHEAEIAGKWLLFDRGDVQFALQGGVLFPHTGLRRAVAGTVQPILSRRLGSRTTVVCNPKLLLNERSVVTLGGGVHYQFNSDWEMFGDLQGAVSGDNSFRTDSGLRTQQEVWGIGFRYTPAPYNAQVSLDLGVTNGLGRTTGYSMQPGLAGSTSFYVQFIYRK